MPAMRKQLILLGLILLVSTAVLLAGDKKSKSRNPEAALAGPTAAPMEDDKKIVHALNRFTFGARPGDVERVRALGLDQWFDQQLHPEKINDSAVQARLAPLRTLNMSTREMIENFPPPQVLKAIEDGRMSMPSDPAKRAVRQPGPRQLFRSAVHRSQPLSRDERAQLGGEGVELRLKRHLREIPNPAQRVREPYDLVRSMAKICRHTIAVTTYGICSSRVVAGNRVPSLRSGLHKDDRVLSLRSGF